MALFNSIAAIVISLITIFLAYILINRFIQVYNSKTLLYRDIETMNIVYDEKVIMDHLNYIIDECMHTYMLYNLTTKEVFYINTAMENDMRTYLVQTIPDRISPALYTKLYLIYNRDDVPTVLAEKIYERVVDFVVDYNLNNEGGQKNK